MLTVLYLPAYNFNLVKNHDAGRVEDIECREKPHYWFSTPSSQLAINNLDWEQPSK